MEGAKDEGAEFDTFKLFDMLLPLDISIHYVMVGIFFVMLK